MSAIDDYIATFPAATRKRLRHVQRAIREEAPDAVETISYGIPTFDLNGRHLVHFAGYARHIGFYPGARVAEAFSAEFSAYKSGKGSVQFPLDRPLPVDLIRRVVQFRIKQSLAKKPSPRRRAVAPATTDSAQRRKQKRTR